MISSDLITARNVTITNCDREQIHIPGAIQPHGILLTLSEPEFTIVQASANVEQVFGVPLTALLNRKLEAFLEKAHMAAIARCLSRDFEYINPLKLAFTVADTQHWFNGILHRAGTWLILELEPLAEQEDTNFFQFYQMTRTTITKLQHATDLEALCQAIVTEIRQLTGYDRVMVYQFDKDGSGTVVAEDKRAELESFLGLHYPRTDIPEPARRLYVLNLLRLIPDIHYQPVPLIPEILPETLPEILPETLPEPETQEPTDLSLSVLRSVSPIHVEYLSNMGVRATMCISLVKSDRLWGLIACHHYAPRYLPYEVRIACEFLGQVMALETSAKEENDSLDDKLRLKALQSRFVESVSQSVDFVEGLLWAQVSLLEIVGAQGAALCTDGEVICVGQTPAKEDIHPLLDWLEGRFENHLFVTQELPALYRPAAEFAAVASGLLALSITKIQKNYVLWFRPEVVQSVNWAGDPNKAATVEADGSITLTPRKSFELWQESVRGKSLPWLPYELDGAVELRSAIVGIVMRRADELAAMNLELERSNTELDSFAYIASHDLKEPLRGIHNYSNFLLEDYGEVLDAAGVSKLETLVRLTQRMEELIEALLHFSRLGRQELNLETLDLNQLVQNVVEILSMSRGDRPDIRIPRPLPTVRGDRILTEEVLSNLIGNGLKYNDKREKWVEIGWLEATGDRPIAFYVKDNGIGIREKHLDSIFRIFKRLHGHNQFGGGTGAGLTIVKKIVERHGGRVWLESIYGEGSTFYFTLEQKEVSPS